MKRKGSKPGEHTSKKKKVEGKDETKLSFESPRECLKSLLSPQDVDKFFSEYWEKKHLHIKRADTKYYGSLFDLEEVYQILDAEEIHYETDINVCKYVDSEKQLLNDEGNASSKDIKKKIENEKATIQFHQPQRFVDILWNLMEKLERHFGCIFGSNVYVTPPGAQGLAPHCDDVEVFILQLEGKKSWKLYKPIDELSRHYSPDLEQSEIGEVMAEITMETGDLLYFPRGTIHQATTVGDNHSTHLTLSTYQNNTVGDLLAAAVKHCLDEAIDNDVEFRRGLPINFLSYLGTGRNVSSYVNPPETNGDTPASEKEEAESNDSKDSRIVDLKKKMKDLLGRLLDHLDMHVAADSLSEDFMSSRLPPYLPDVEDDGEKEENAPTLSSSIKIRYHEHVRLVIYSDDDDDEDDEAEEDSAIEDNEVDEDQAPSKKEDNKKPGKKGRPKTRSSSSGDSKGKSTKAGKERTKSAEDVEMSGEDTDDDDDEDDSNGPNVTVLHSLHNDRRCHMVGDVHEGGIRLPLHFARALQYVMDHHKEFVPVKDLPSLDDSDKVKLAVHLWSDGLLDVKS